MVLEVRPHADARCVTVTASWFNGTCIDRHRCVKPDSCPAMFVPTLDNHIFCPTVDLAQTSHPLVVELLMAESEPETRIELYHEHGPATATATPSQDGPDARTRTCLRLSWNLWCVS